MERGDISNEAPPRIVFVFEGLIGRLPDQKAVQVEKLALRFRRWQTALDQYEFHRYVVSQLWDCAWRKNVRVDVLTFKGEEFARLLQRRFDDETVPVHHVMGASSPHRWARRLAYVPDIARVIDPDPRRQFLYGVKGVLVDPDQPFVPLA